MYKFRLYIKENIEVFEIISETGTLIKRHYGALGSSFSNFIYCDLLGLSSLLEEIFNLYKNNDTNKEEKLLEIADQLPKISFYFHLYSNELYGILDNKLSPYDGKKVIQKLCHNLYDIRAMQVYINSFIVNCFDQSLNDKVDIVKEYDNIIKTEINHFKFEPVISKIEYSFYPEEKYNYSIFSNKDSELCPVIYPKTIEEIIYFLSINLFIHKPEFKVCKNCCKYFVLSGRKNAEYCDRMVDDSDKTCKDVGSVRKYLSKRSTDPIKRVFTKAYNTKNARIRYGMITKEEFNIWAEKARAKRQECIDGKISLEDLELWLSSDVYFYQTINNGYAKYPIKTNTTK